VQLDDELRGAFILAADTVVAVAAASAQGDPVD
jgi:hypothetical protein